MPSPLVNHLCSMFTSHPRASLIIARATGLVFSTPPPPSSSSPSSASTSPSPTAAVTTAADPERQVTGVEVQIRDSPDGSESTNTTKVIPADAVVLAAGPWLGKLAVQLLGETIGAELCVWGAQANSILLRTKETLTAHAVFARIRMGAEREDENEPEVYCRPDGTTYL